VPHLLRHRVLPGGFHLTSLLKTHFTWIFHEVSRLKIQGKMTYMKGKSSQKDKKMNDKNYTTGFTVDQTPAEVFEAINNVRGWWSGEIDGDTDRLGAEFSYHYQNIHRCRMKIIEFIPNQKVVWQVLDNYFSFTQNPSEWKGTKISFEISGKGDETEVRFTHIGLVPQYECYDVCVDGWGTYINGSLRDLITKGTGHPNVGEAITGSEHSFVNEARP